MKIALFEVSKEEQVFFSQLLNNLEVSFFEEKLDENNANLAKRADVICVFVNSAVNKKVIDALPNLKFIATRSTGFNHIDCEYAKTKGIKISNVPAYGSHTVAEFTFGLILNFSRNIIKANNYIRESSDFNYFSAMEGFDLEGKTLGIIGLGKIGKNVLKIAKAFGMNIVAYDLYPDSVFAKENDFEYKGLTEVISESDILTLHAPYNKENHHLINKKNISLMKKGVYLINTARGALIDTEALLWGLKEGIIAGAGLDVLEGEQELKEEIQILSSLGKSTRIKNYKTLLEDHVLIDLPNVIITPHIAFYTREAVAEILRITTENIKGFSANNPINLVK
ncbi:MAG: D-isomer specific 2-hydroxyacid dehydrogenase NAD-binding protein [Parcubacteria group bacterium GW2011_GWB1_36_5]|nr:MAG: D-isomer specific 2-hydroxyacid dehydrogenase NAD-binding protein [Parcubacteria group bacterium GW2011_GWA2_36_24]KKQ07562.1 MAG: D-isomer specific 2-hydroxyacid dehydrogenase NAD-binding protein [Parcubacteria group bacterium GW2011_GWB1_36_5]